MNIRFAICPLILVLSFVSPALAQASPNSSVKPQSTNSPAVAAGTQASSSSSAGTVPSAFPNEKTLLIGKGATNASHTVKAVKPLGVWDYVQMILVLALVVAGIYLLFYFLKRVGGPKFQENSLIGVLSTKVLQPNRALHLVDVGGQLYLVGTSENSVSLVASIDDKEAVDEIRVRAAQGGSRPDRKSFLDAFSGAFRKGVAGGFGGSIMDSMGFMKQQRERLKKM